MKKNILLISICCILLITGCSNNKLNPNIEQNDTKGSDIKMSNVKVTINDKVYVLNLENNKTVNEFIDLLPQDFTMNELNGNEKYVYIDNSLITSSYNPGHIEKGDVMLYGNNCIVIFYKSFDTSYSYSKIGHIDNLDNLGNGNVVVKFEKN
jgi:hypothetical protein